MAETYTIYLNDNGGSGGPGSFVKTAGVYAFIPGGIPTRADYTFLGWAESSSATSADYQPGGMFGIDQSMTLYAVWTYTPRAPRITSMSAFRCNSDGSANSSGGWGAASFSFECDRPVREVIFYSRPPGGSSWYQVNWSSYFSGTSGSVTNWVFGEGKYDPYTTYEICLRVNDGVITDKYGYMTGYKFTMDCIPNARGVAFGKYAEHVDWADFAYHVYLRGHIMVDPADGDVMGIWNPGSGIKKISVDPEVYFNRSWICANGIKSNTTGHIDLGMHGGQSGVDIWWRPYYTVGDTIDLSSPIHTTGYITSDGWYVKFTIPVDRPIIDASHVDIVGINGFIIRQWNNYLYGSSANGWVHPQWYEAWIVQGSRVCIQAYMKDTINVTNNAPCGIQWSGRILVNAS